MAQMVLYGYGHQVKPVYNIPAEGSIGRYVCWFRPQRTSIVQWTLLTTTPTNVDHYRCYNVKLSEGTTFTPVLGVSVDDQFITDPRKLFDLKKPTRLCNPVEKTVDGNVTEIKNPDTHLMCYQAKPTKGQPKHVRVLGIFVNNQFGPEQLDTVKEDELCVPSVKTLPTP